MSKKEKAPKVKKDKATIKAEKAEKKAARKAQRKEDRKNPEIKAANRTLAIKCIAAILCAVLFFFNISSAFDKIAEMIKATESTVVSTGSSSGSGAGLDAGLDSGLGGDSLADTTPDAGATDTTPDAGATDTTPDANAGDAGTTDTSKPADTANKGGKPADGVETLNYFNTAVNKVKTGAKSVNQKSVTNYLASTPTIPSALNGIYKMLGGDGWLDDTLKKNSQGAATYTGADIKAKFPVEGESYASKLTPSDVKSATCTEKDGIYTITIVTLDDAKSESHKHGTGHNPKAHNVILPGVVNDNIPGPAVSLVGKASMAYPSSTIVITVDAATGNVLTANYDLKWTINFDKMGAVIPLGSKSIYEIKW
ncbi:MAG: hypothetical protein J6A67_09425 [Clostridia bacterium]|nr:hypothetical protein [Clostridia bacterium]